MIVTFDPPSFSIEIDIPDNVDPLEYAYEWAEKNEREVMEAFEDAMSKTYFELEVG